MFPRKSSLVLTAAASLLLGQSAFSEPADRAGQADRSGQADQTGQSGQGQGGQARQGGQDQSDAQQQQINQVLAQIAADPKTAADKLFILTAAIHNQSEIELAKEVLQKTQNEQVKRLAQQMIKSLQQTHDQLQQTAQAIGLPLPKELAQAAIQEVHIVAALPADQLDQQYTAHVQADNAQDLSTSQSEAKIAQDPQVKKYAQDQVAADQQRTQDADQTAQGMGMPGSRDAQPAGAKLKGDNR